jgi:glycosyltransferase involved in cell wall biosynthesis
MENNIPNFTFCITSKNNLRYLKHAISYIKDNCFNKNHEILVFIDSDNDGTEEWCKSNNVDYIKNPTQELYGIGRAYNLLVKNVTTEFVVIYHADMLAGRNFDINLYKHWQPKTVISATRIEPPLHPADPAKIVENFGLWPEVDIQDGFKENEFDLFVEKSLVEFKDKTTNGIFAPWLIHKDDFIDRRGIVRPVFTLIVCLDMDCDGGEIGFYSLNKKLIDKIKVHSETPEKKKIVMFNGGLYNKAEPIKNGKRVIVSYRIKQVEPSKYEEYHVHYPYTK